MYAHVVRTALLLVACHHVHCASVTHSPTSAAQLTRRATPRPITSANRRPKLVTPTTTLAPSEDCIGFAGRALLGDEYPVVYTSLGGESVTVDGCGLVEIDQQAFMNQGNLETLSLSNNRIKNLPVGVFDGLSSLQNLNLSSNEITELRADNFQRMSSLKHLNMSSNRLTKISSGTFNNLSNLQTIDLSKNFITKIVTNTFIRLIALKFVNMRHNKITELQTGSFSNVPNLNYLFLSFNNLTMIHTNMFTTVQNKLSDLKIDHNLISYLPNDFFEFVPNLRRFFFEGNAWQCPCLDEILRWVSTNNVAYFKHDYYKGKRPICVVGESDQCERDAETSPYFRLTYKLRVEEYPPVKD